METTLRKMGNSQGVLIPKPIVAQLGLEGKVQLHVRDGVLEIRPLKADPRKGWADDAKRLARAEDDALVWPEFGNADDSKLTW